MSWRDRETLLMTDDENGRSGVTSSKEDPRMSFSVGASISKSSIFIMYKSIIPTLVV